MASIHKDPRGKSPFFYCAFKLPNGKRCFKSTKLTERSAAMMFCLKMEAASDKANARNLTEEQARKILDEIRVLGGEEAIRLRPLGQYCSDWLESKKATASPATQARYASIIADFLGAVGAQRIKAGVETVTARDIKNFRDAELRAGKSPTTANLALKTLRSVFNDVRREGLITTNPAEQVDMLKAQTEARDVFTHEQLTSILAVAPAEWKTAVFLGCRCGLRLGDAVGLAWENVNLDRGEIRFFPRKTSHGLARRPDWKKHVNGQLEIPMPVELEAHLLSISSSDDPAAMLCPTLATKGTGGNKGLSMSFQRIMAGAGVHADTGIEKTGKGRQFRTLGFHSLRHNFISALANADVPASVRQMISGHKDEDVHERYTHLDMDTKRRAMAKMRPLTP